MHTLLNEKIIALRKYHKFSQAETAKQLKMSRSSFAQIELGNRTLSAMELWQLAQVFQFSIDDFFSKDFVIEKPTSNAKPADTIEKSTYLRIDKPTLIETKFQQVFLYFLNACINNPMIDEVMLHHLLYLADFNYYEVYETHLSTLSYRRQMDKPYPIDIGGLLDIMEKEKLIKSVKVDYEEAVIKRFISLQKPDLHELRGSEVEMINQIVQQFSHWSKEALIAYVGEDMPVKAAKPNELLEYELVFYREPPYICVTEEEGEL